MLRCFKDDLNSTEKKDKNCKKSRAKNITIQGAFRTSAIKSTLEICFHSKHFTQINIDKKKQKTRCKLLCRLR